MHSHNSHQLAIDILTELAHEMKKPVSRVKRLFAITQNQYVYRRFWEILDAKIPNNHFTGIFHCQECDMFSFESHHSSDDPIYQLNDPDDPNDLDDDSDEQVSVTCYLPPWFFK